jgi:hypothetical protein
VERLRVQGVRRSLLDDATEIHDRDDIGDVADDGQIVRDHHIRQSQPVLQFLQQVDHLGLDRYVQRGDRLVGDDQVRFQRNRAGDANALPLAAGELVRVPPRCRRWQSDQVEELGNGPRSPHLDAVRPPGFCEHRLDALSGIQACHRILEDHLHPAPHPTQVLTFQRVHVDAVEADRSSCRLDQPEHRST